MPPARWFAVGSSGGGEPAPDTEQRLTRFSELVATAVSDAEARGELDRLAHEQAALRRVATLVARGVSPAETFAAVATEVGQLLGADLTCVIRYEDDGTATIAGGWSPPGLDLPIGVSLDVAGEGAGVSVREAAKPARVERFEGPPGSIAGHLRSLGARSGVGAPITVEGRLWGAVIAATTARESLPLGSESWIGDFSELVATAIANAQARVELTASRARLVAAGDEVRRRIERDLHDGIQQRLVTLALELRGVVEDLPAGYPRVSAQASAVAGGLREVLDELRELSRGIHPAVLSEGGLRPALKSLVRRSSVPVEFQLGEIDRLPQPVEVAAYYAASEALTNVAKHADASVVHLELGTRDGRLRLEIRDDGIGGADPAGGSGLLGLTDRVEALGGMVSVTSPPGQGTAIVIELP